MASKLGTAFKNALNKVISNQAAIFDYSNQADFYAIWNESLFLKLRNKTEIIVVWADSKDFGAISPSDALLKTHLTPFDWALAFSIHMLDSQGDNLPFLSIHIIDLSLNHLDEESWATGMRHQLLADMPWVKLYTPLKLYATGSFSICESIISPNDDLGAETPLLINEHDTWKLNPKACLRTISSSFMRGGRTQLKNLERQWKAFLSLSDYYHDVNNIIGPTLLSGVEKFQQRMKKAFLARLIWSGDNLELFRNWGTWDAKKAAETRLFNQNLSVLVVDDQLDQGWENFVCRLLECNSSNIEKLNNNEFTQLNSKLDKVKIFGCLGAQPLIEFLNSAKFVKRDYFEQVRKDAELSPELILLDLRLYPQIEKAKEQTRSLIDLVKRISLMPEENLAWPKICQTEVAHIQEWCNGSSEDGKVSDEALLLLPRLLALALPLTPIILFSSTGQAWIRERLKPYRNVFTGFEKPRVLNNPDSVNSSIIAIHDALDNAVKMMRLRLQLAHAQKAIQIASDERPEEGDRLNDQHIEIYADETRTLEEGIISGMAVCIFPTIQTEEDLQNKLLSEFSKQGVVWAKERQSRKDPELEKGSAICKDNLKCGDQVGKVDVLLNDVGLSGDYRKLWSVVAMRVKEKLINIKELSLASFPDGPLDEAIRFNLEFILFVLIPYIAEDNWYKDGNIHINIPTRIVPFPPGNKEQMIELGGKLCKSFNLGDRQWDDIDELTTIVKIPTANLSKSKESSANNIGTAFPLVRGWLHSWRGATPNISTRITKIVMSTLSRGEGKGISENEAINRPLFHDIADWICTASNPDVRKKLKECLEGKGIFNNWFISTDTRPIGSGPRPYYKDDTANSLILMRTLRMSLTFESQKYSNSDVVREILNNSYIYNCNERLLTDHYCAQQRLILWRLKNMLLTMSGESLHNLLYIETNILKTDINIADETDCVINSSATLLDTEHQKLDRELIVPINKEILDEIPDSLIGNIFPNAQQYFSGSDLRNSTVIYFRSLEATAPKLTHCVKDADQVKKIKSGQWCKPLTVIGVETCDCDAGGEKIIYIQAAKMDNGNWKSLSLN